MKLYLLTQDENDGYDTYDSAVVVAENKYAARHIHPDGDKENKPWWLDDDMFSSWATKPANVKAREIGIAAPRRKGGKCIIASYNAG